MFLFHELWLLNILFYILFSDIKEKTLKSLKDFMRDVEEVKHHFEFLDGLKVSISRIFFIIY